MFSSSADCVSAMSSFLKPSSPCKDRCCGTPAATFPGSIGYLIPVLFGCPAKQSATDSTALVWYCCFLNFNFISLRLKSITSLVNSKLEGIYSCHLLFLFFLFLSFPFQHPLGGFARARIFNKVSLPHAGKNVSNLVLLLLVIQGIAQLNPQELIYFLTCCRAKLRQIICNLLGIELIILRTGADIVGFRRSCIGNGCGNMKIGLMPLNEICAAQVFHHGLIQWQLLLHPVERN